MTPVEAEAGLASPVNFESRGGATSDGQQLLIQYLHDRDEPCPLCRYNLRGLTSTRCPECGRELRLTVGLTEPFMRAWAALAAITCASAGVGAFLLAAVLWWGWPPFRGGLMGALSIYSFGTFWAMFPAAAAVLNWRRALLRVSPEKQWLGVGVAAIVAVTAFLSFFLTVR